MGEATNGERERAYQALRDSEALHRITLSNISDAVFLTDDDGLFTFICPNVDVIFGYLPDEVKSMSLMSRLLGEGLFDRAELKARGELRNIERDITTKSGEHRAVLVHLKEVSIQGGTVLYCCRDVTERRHAEDELRTVRQELAHASRLAVLGELTASIGHELRQPLTAILANTGAGLRLLAGEAGSDGVEDLREIISDIRDQCRSAGDVMERLQGLAGKRPPEPQILDVNEVVRDTLWLVGGDLRRRKIDLCTDFLPSLPTVTADRVGLQQVVLNLLLNAMDAMDQVVAGGRRLTVRTRRLDGVVEVTVSDTGGGIPTDRFPRLFDAFFTTKEQGLGLGLAIARTIVEAHGGEIWAEDDAARGATFHVTLPLPAGG